MMVFSVSAGQGDVVTLAMVEVKFCESVVGKVYNVALAHQKASPETLCQIERGSPSSVVFTGIIPCFRDLLRPYGSWVLGVKYVELCNMLGFQPSASVIIEVSVHLRLYAYSWTIRDISMDDEHIVNRVLGTSSARKGLRDRR